MAVKGKKRLYYVILFGCIWFLVTVFSTKSNKAHYLLLSQNKVRFYNFPTKNLQAYNTIGIPYLDKFFVGFKEAIAFKESQGKYNKVNTSGHLGKYQFGKSTLYDLGVHDSVNFIANKELQEKAFLTLLKRNKWRLRNTIKNFNGKTIDGVLITESGILAAAHLGGVGSVKKYLYSRGVLHSKDAYGTTIKYYLQEFAGYETQNIHPQKNATVKK